MNALIDEIGKTNFTDSKKQRLKALCPTRWVERHESLITFKELIIPVVTVLETLSDSKTPEISSKAYMLSCAIKKSEFIVGLEVAVYCLGLTLRLSQRLQSPKQDLSSALVSVTDILENFRNIRREADLEFNSLYENAVQLADELGFDISTPRTCRRQQNRSNTPSESAEEYFRRTIFLPLVDHFISEIDKRFNRDFCGVLPLEGLIPANLERFTDDTIVSAAEKYQIFTDQIGSFSLLTAEIKMWRNKWRNACNPPDTVIDAIKELDYSFFPMISTLLQVLGTIPVTTATAERSFSTLKR
ncbi:uncharacterized protein LOC128983590 [Macrosteles quadrilineatus]|uniref:uncharacterized protein LOC128983590 n=1 Tax=Macrosteles quadrilineatus TaxID=74068 RepID=UPI0023E2CE8A|nr:uncharacterized protein LOC128983590 [Macrosteles quadrilineatus]